MDANLLKLSVDYHGPALIECLNNEQPNVDVPHSRRPLTHARRTTLRLSEDTFQQKLMQFIARKADLLFATDTRGDPSHLQRHVEDDKCCAVIAPLETSMQILSADRRLHCLQCLQKGDIVMGVVSAVQDAGLLITLFCLDGGKVRDIDELNITAFCPVSELPRYYAHEGPLEAFTIKDRVRGVVLSVMPAQENVVVSLKSNAGDHAHIKMIVCLGTYSIMVQHYNDANIVPARQDVWQGLIDDDHVPPHYTLIADVTEGSYPRQLKASSGFNNPRSVEYLSDLFDLRVTPAPSLMRGLCGVMYPEGDCRESLRKTQSRRLAMKSVSDGVGHFKAGRHIEAMQYLNKALQIDEENVDALVARGALYANNESYSRAIDDFTAALKLNPHHKNARKYTCETLVAHAKGLADMNNEDEAVNCLEQALQLEPHLEEARVMLHRLQCNQSRPGGGLVTEVVEVSDGESESEDDQDEKAEIRRVSATLRKLIKQDKVTAKHRSRRASGSDTIHTHKDHRSSGGKKRKKKKRRSNSNSDDDRPAKRRRHSRPSDTDSEKSRRRHRSSSAEAGKSPVSSHSREDENRQSRKSRLSSTGDARIDSVEMAPLSSRRRHSTQNSRRRNLSREHRTHSRERINEKGREKPQATDMKPQATDIKPRATDKQYMQSSLDTSEKSQRSREKLTEGGRRSSEFGCHDTVTMTTEVKGSVTEVKGSVLPGKQEELRRESLDEMENFLKILKERKKQMEGKVGTK